MSEVETGTVVTNGLEFTYLSAGADDTSRPLALCLHGFPDSAHGWRYLLPELAKAGYRAIAPFQRGYAPTQIPNDGCYQSGALSVDANSLHEALAGDGDAIIIGHDWGAVGTHAAAVTEPARWRQVVTMSIPPGNAVAVGFLTNLNQVQKSWYMFFFLHGLADIVVPANDLAFIDRLWAQWSPGYDATTDLRFAKDALRDPANLAAALGYYRATLGNGKRDERYEAAQNASQVVPSQPMLYMHGRDDGCLGLDVLEAAQPSLPPNVNVKVIDDAGHFLHIQQPTIVNAHILDFVR